MSAIALETHSLAHFTSLSKLAWSNNKINVVFVCKLVYVDLAEKLHHCIELLSLKQHIAYVCVYRCSGESVDSSSHSYNIHCEKGGI